MKFSRVITIDKNDVPVKVQGHTSKVKVTDLKKKKQQKKKHFAPIWGFLDCNSSFNSQMATKWCTKLEVA